MKKFCLWALLLIAFTSFCFAKGFVFRATYWGMSKSQVKNVESAEYISENDDNLLYRTSFLNLDADLQYEFYNNKLFQGSYLFKTEHDNCNGYLDDFNIIDNFIFERYGPAKNTDFNWKNASFRNGNNNLGMAVALGYLVICSTWETEDAIVIHQITGENFQVTHHVIYKSTESPSSDDEIKVEDLVFKGDSQIDTYGGDVPSRG